MKHENLIGGIYGYRTVVGTFLQHKKKGKMWLCECLCGNNSHVSEYTLLSNDRKSCGCLGSKCSVLDWSDDGGDTIKNFVNFEDAKNLGMNKYGKFYCTKCNSEEFFSIPRTGGCMGCARIRKRSSLSNSLRSLLGSMYRKIGRDNPRYKYSELMGCDTQTLGEHVESLFHKNPITGLVMSYDNRGMYGVPEKWQLDHVIPMEQFDLTNRDDVLKCCHYKNIKPLWTVEHIQKTNFEQHGKEETLENIWDRIISSR